jgi:predicted dehydrogenase
MNAPLRFALVGTGSIAAAYEAAFRDLPQANIVAVCDVRREAAAPFGKRLDCPVYTTCASLTRHNHLDAAIICTPPSTHEGIAKALLSHGINVLCEKPLCTSVAGAYRMIEAAHRSSVLLTMASKFRYADDVRRARTLVRAGCIGQLVFVENAFTSRVNMMRRWNSNSAISGGGVLMDNGTHGVDLLRYFLGKLRDLQVIEGRRIQGLAVEDTVRVFVRNDEGVMGTSDLSWSIDKELDTYLRLYGSDGTILVGWKESKYRRRDDPQWHIFGKGYDKIQAFRSQLENFCDAIKGEAELVITPRDALASVEVISAAYAALERSRWQDIASRVEDGALPPLPAFATEPLEAS